MIVLTRFFARLIYALWWLLGVAALLYMVLFIYVAAFTDKPVEFDGSILFLLFIWLLLIFFSYIFLGVIDPRKVKGKIYTLDRF